MRRAFRPFQAALPQRQLPEAVVAVLGFCIGCYGTIVGIGGGPIIMPILFLLYGWTAELLVATSLFVVLMNATSGSAGYAWQGRIDYVGGIKFACAAAPGAGVAGLLHHVFDFRAFHVLFGVFLILLGVYSLLALDRADVVLAEAPETGRARYRHVVIRDARGVTFDYYSNDSLGIVFNLVMGLVAGFLGIGGGVIQVPLLLYGLRYPVHLTTATSHFITMLTSAAALVPHLFLGNIQFAQALWMGIGVLVGAQLGARLARGLSSTTIVLLFVVVVFGFGAKLLVE